METVKIKKVRENAVVPQRATDGSAGADLCACIDEPITINPGDLAKVPTGIAIALPSANMGAFLFARSGLGVKHGICLSNGVGVVDSDYRGEVVVALHNDTNDPQTYHNGDRIAQLVIMPYLPVVFDEVDKLDETERGEGGFGHTGV